MPAVITQPVAARTLVPAPLFTVLAKRTVTDFGADPAMADLVIDQATALLATASRARRPLRLRPSPFVDAGWHAWLMYPARLREFFVSIGGRQVDHVPDDDPFATRAAASTGPLSLARTVKAITAAGYIIYPNLWPTAADCADEGNCGASGEDGNENLDTQLPPP